MTRLVDELVYRGLSLRGDIPLAAHDALARYQVPQSKPNPQPGGETNMLKVCTSYSKKVPAEKEYSSQQYHASVEVELSDALSPEELQKRIHQTFAVVRSTVEAEINGQAPSGNSREPGGKPNGNSKASNAQIKFMTSLASEQNVRLSGLNAYVKDNFGVESIYELTKKDASAVVEALQHSRVKVRV
jgi:hypothetical protein